MDAATAAAANAHPSQKFAIVDDAPTVKAGTHVDALQYETDQAGFLGGILAAGPRRPAPSRPTEDRTSPRSRST